MPEIKIQLSEIEELKQEIIGLEQINEALEEKLDALSEQQLKNNAIKLGMSIAKQYLASISRAIGLKDSKADNITLQNPSYYEKYFGKMWWECDDMYANISVKICEGFQKLYLELIDKVKENSGDYYVNKK